MTGILFVVLSSLCLSVSAFPLQVEINSGRVRGARSETRQSVVAFRSIPYAEAPVGENRWKPPVPKAKWEGVFSAKKWGAICHPAGLGFSAPLPGTVVDEDCLSVNVWVPPAVDELEEGESLPVVVFLHGGAFMLGSSQHPFTAPDPSEFCELTRAVFVSMNYRLGPLGFMYHHDIESPGAGVFGLLDQQLALRWVQDNIHHFGGNPNKVTLMGESAGAFSICLHLVSESSRSLFQRVLLQSGMCDFHFADKEMAHNQSLTLISEMGCDGTSDPLACMRRKPAGEVNSKLRTRRGLLFYEGIRWFPVIDEVFIPGPPQQMMREGRMVTPDVDMLIGSNQDEGTLFLLISHPLYVFDNLVGDMFSAAFTEEEATVLTHEYDSFGGDGRKMLSQAFTDMFSCSVRRTALAASQSGRNVYLYLFGQEPRNFPYPFSGLGSFHGMELNYIFNRAAINLVGPDKRVIQTMIRTWGNFIHSGDPNVPFPSSTLSVPASTPVWQKYDGVKESYVVIASGPEHDSDHAVLEQRHAVEFDGDHYELCPVFDRVVRRQGGVVSPPDPFPERWPSYIVNFLVIHFFRTIRLNPEASAGVGVFLLLWSCWRCCRCCGLRPASRPKTS